MEEETRHFEVVDGQVPLHIVSGSEAFLDIRRPLELPDVVVQWVGAVLPDAAGAIFACVAKPNIVGFVRDEL